MLASPLLDRGDGTYEFLVSSAATGLGTVVVTVEGLTLSAQPQISYTP